MKAYKGFTKEMTCHGGFQYEEGKSYHENNAKLCDHGFHACEYPLDCFNYFPPAESVFHEVELDGITGEREGDTKICGTDIKIGAKLDIAGLIKASFDYVKAHCENNKAGGDWSALTGGNSSALTGGNSSALTGGDWSALGGGNWSALTGGDWSALRGGYRSALIGGDMSVLTGGDGSALTGGDRSALTGGDRSALAGGKAAIMRGGKESTFKGDMWSVFACEIRDDKYRLIGMATAVVDGENIKPNTWYKCVDGEFVELEDTND